MSQQPQSFANHARIVPLYHFVVFPILLLNLGWAFYGLYLGLSFQAVLNVLMAIALLILFFYARLFALGAQDRVIRLEMRLRMRELLPADLQSRINDFSAKQMTALRFAGDAELPQLARKVIDENLTSVKQIKQLVVDWQADYCRL